MGGVCPSYTVGFYLLSARLLLSFFFVLEYHELSVPRSNVGERGKTSKHCAAASLVNSLQVRRGSTISKANQTV